MTASVHKGTLNGRSSFQFPDTSPEALRLRQAEGTVGGMMLWINGTFGVGKTTTGQALVEARTALRLFDPEAVGYMLMNSLKDQAFSDFQDLPAWRAPVPATAIEIRRHTGQHLVAVQTVLRQDYWEEPKASFREQNDQVVHIVLDADEETLRNRVENDQVELSARQWRLDHLERYAAARMWMIKDADLVIDTSRLTPEDVASRIAEVVPAKLPVH